jgi:tetratricopeptide (TPR) repeat protein
VHIERALTLDRTSPWAWGSHSWAKAYRGQANEAIECFQIARAIAPFDRLHFLCCHGIGGSMFDAGRYEESVAWYSRGVVENPAALWMNRWLVAAYVLAGRKDEGRHTLAELRKADPELTIADVRSGLPWHSDFLDRVADGLESAGLHP